jgi:endonuclease/exonuclease/phosphatase family metal-dependent hydrolase
MKRRYRAILLLVAVPVFAVVVMLLFVLNGVALCDGNTARSGTVVSVISVPESRPASLRVLSYNIAKCFVYAGGGCFSKRADVESRLSRMSTIIRDANPDVVCLSEIVRECGLGNVDQVRYLAEHTGLTNWAFGENFSFGLPFFRVVSGNAILSRYPVSPRYNVPLAGRKPFYVMMNNRRALGCAVMTPWGDVPVWALHNDSFSLSNNLVQIKQVLVHPFSRDAFIAGDLNAQPGDKSLLLIQNSGRFTGIFDGPPTFPATDPSRTIDFVFAPSSWAVQEHEVITNVVSDHLAVMTEFIARDDGPSDKQPPNPSSRRTTRVPVNADRTISDRY